MVGILCASAAARARSLNNIDPQTDQTLPWFQE
jgi:hypothetical protein